MKKSIPTRVSANACTATSLTVCAALLTLACSATWAQTATATATPKAAATADSEPQGPGLAVRTWRSLSDWSAWQGPGQWRLGYSPYTWHYRYNPEHAQVWALGLERERADHWLAGVSYFKNSFGQPSAYVYAGKRWPELFGVAQLYTQASAGLLYGYRGAYKHKVPLNVNGFSPGALLTAGWRFSPRMAGAVHLLGDAGMMFELSMNLD